MGRQHKKFENQWCITLSFRITTKLFLPFKAGGRHTLRSAVVFFDIFAQPVRNENIDRRMLTHAFSENMPGLSNNFSMPLKSSRSSIFIRNSIRPSKLASSSSQKCGLATHIRETILFYIFICFIAQQPEVFATSQEYEAVCQQKNADYDINDLPETRDRSAHGARLVKEST